MAFGRNGERVAKTPTRSKARRAHRRRPCVAHGGRELPDEPQVRKALDAAQRVGMRYSGSKTIFARSAGTRPLWRGMPNFSGKSEWILAMTFIV